MDFPPPPSLFPFIRASGTLERNGLFFSDEACLSMNLFFVGVQILPRRLERRREREREREL